MNQLARTGVSVESGGRVAHGPCVTSFAMGESVDSRGPTVADQTPHTPRLPAGWPLALCCRGWTHTMMCVYAHARAFCLFVGLSWVHRPVTVAYGHALALLFFLTTAGSRWHFP